MKRAAPIDFAAGQLSHLGQYYDVYEGDVALRVLVIAMEPGRPDVGITLPMRRRQVLDHSAALPPRARNPHMVGVTHTLRTMFGRPIGDDAAGEHLNFGSGHDLVHLFDAFAMANVRLCTSVKAGTKQSYPTAVMTQNCVRHLVETVRIFQPSVCIVQSTRIPKELASAVTSRRQISPNLAEGGELTAPLGAAATGAGATADGRDTRLLYGGVAALTAAAALALTARRRRYHTD